LFAGGVDFDPDAIDAADDYVVQSLLKQYLVDIMLILADANGLGVDFDKFCKRVHQTPGNGNRAADSQVFVGEFLAGGIRSRIDRCAAFIAMTTGDGVVQPVARGLKVSVFSRPAVPLPMAMASISTLADRFDLFGVFKGLSRPYVRVDYVVTEKSFAL
jgi:hypothetical protein